MLTTTDHTKMQDTLFPAPRRRRNATVSVFTPPPATTTAQIARAPRPRAPSNIPLYRGATRPLPRRVAQLRAGHKGAEVPMRSTREERWRAVRTGWEAIEIGDEVERHGRDEVERHGKDTGEGEGEGGEGGEEGEGGKGGRQGWGWAWRLVAAVLGWVWAWGWVGGFLWWVFGVA
ncbi:hypothetical protein EDC01DRAFT_779142 [Geopyxis carbonaria]|nr:hypothetical protein EDC01DRAFT_779142 [Geopyxis carbonaria]